MRLKVACLLFAAAITTPSGSSAQPPVDAAAPQREVVMQPLAAPPSRSPRLQDLVLAKMDRSKDDPKLIMMVETFREEKVTAMITRLVQEQREREVEVDGEKVKQKYTVAVPVTEEREVVRRVPAGKKPVSTDAKEFNFMNLDNEPVSIDDASKLLTGLRPVFLMDGGVQPSALSPIAKQTMKKGCLIVATKKKIRHRPNVPGRAPALPRAALRP